MAVPLFAFIELAELMELALDVGALGVALAEAAAAEATAVLTSEMVTSAVASAESAFAAVEAGEAADLTGTALNIVQNVADTVAQLQSLADGVGDEAASALQEFAESRNLSLTDVGEYAEDVEDADAVDENAPAEAEVEEEDDIETGEQQSVEDGAIQATDTSSETSSKIAWLGLFTSGGFWLALSLLIFFLGSVVAATANALCRLSKTIRGQSTSTCQSAVCNQIKAFRKWAGSNQILYYGAAASLSLPFFVTRHYYSGVKWFIVSMLLAWLILSIVGYLLGTAVCDIASFGDSIKGIF